MRATILFVFLWITNTYSQNASVKINYDFNLNLNDNQQYKSVLYIGKEKSLFLWNKPFIKNSRIEDEESINVNLNANDTIGSFNLGLRLKDSIYSRIPYFKKEVILLKEKVPSIEWKIHKETKKVGDFQCQKAVANFRGREYTAWFAPDLPIKVGPWKLHGLPGLILIAYDTKREIEFYVTSISQSSYKIEPSLKANRIMYLSEYIEFIEKGPLDFLKKLKSKLPRGTEMTVDIKKGIESFE
ncbi:GLPGLI family protein [Tenacibaculum sp. MEBiC06402]|uniref:GLPGLI family protein n=1 Tax=unclassified Tenacibaculum TaxID=2635139 RepID=UPI003B99916F